jgi:hypothetical protein
VPAVSPYKVPSQVALKVFTANNSIEKAKPAETRRFNKRSFIMSRKPTPVRALILITIFLIPLAFAAPVSAELIVWTLAGVKLTDGYDGTVTGSFKFDTNTLKISDWNITETFTRSHTFEPGAGSEAITSLNTYDGIQFQHIEFTYIQPGYPDTEGTWKYVLTMLYATQDHNSLSIPGYHTLSGGTYNVTDKSQSYGAYVTSGALTSVPLPPSMFLLGSGLMGLAGWRRFRKG